MIHAARLVYREVFLRALTGTSAIPQFREDGKRRDGLSDRLVESAHQIATSAVSTIFGEETAQEISNADLSAWESK